MSLDDDTERGVMSTQNADMPTILYTGKHSAWMHRPMGAPTPIRLGRGEVLEGYSVADDVILEMDEASTVRECAFKHLTVLKIGEGSPKSRLMIDCVFAERPHFQGFDQ